MDSFCFSPEINYVCSSRSLAEGELLLFCGIECAAVADAPTPAPANRCAGGGGGGCAGGDRNGIDG